MTETSPTRSAPVAPRRRFTLTVTAGADTLDEARRLLLQLARDMRDSPGPILTGGCSFGGVAELQERDVTPEGYQDELAAYLESLP
jgi:hypothetical protein